MGVLSWLKRAFGRDDSVTSVSTNVSAPVAAPAAPVLAAAVSALPANLLVHVEFGRAIPGPAPGVIAESIRGLCTPATPTVARFFAAAEVVDALVDEVEGDLFYSKIAGVTKRNSRGPNRQKLLKELEDWTELYLFPEPENRFSTWAIRVENSDGNQLGYIPDQTARDISAQIARGHCYRCFVSEITGWEHSTLGVNIALVHWDPIYAARPERDFERFMSNVTTAVDGEWFYARLVGLTKSNEDGTPRRKLFGTLEHKEQLEITPDSDTPETAKYVYLCNSAGQRLGALGLKQSVKVLDAVAAGRRWAAFYRDCTEQDAPPGFRPNIAMLCLGVAASAQTITNGGRWP